jgi:hypothetical protein
MNMRITIEVTEEKEYEIEHDEDYWICDSVLWKMRDEIDPPREGFVMYSSSGAEHNLEYLLENGWKPEDVTTQYGDTKVKKNDEVDTST